MNCDWLDIHYNIDFAHYNIYFADKLGYKLMQASAEFSCDNIMSISIDKQTEKRRTHSSAYCVCSYG